MKLCNCEICRESRDPEKYKRAVLSECIRETEELIQDNELLMSLYPEHERGLKISLKTLEHLLEDQKKMFKESKP